MKVGIAQINVTPGDFEGNYANIQRAMENLIGADLVVFPELAICGYNCRDLLYQEGFIESNLIYLDKLKSFSSHPDHQNKTIVIGYADRSNKEHGKPFKNMAAVIRDGLIIATYQKQLLPFYDVFDEPRYFEPGNELCKIDIAGVICGITICEDLWNDKGQDDYNYDNNPVERYVKNGVKCIINLSASPYYVGKRNLRASMGEKITAEHGIILIYANQVGGQDELVFDGNSFIANNGCTTAINPTKPKDVFSTFYVNSFSENLTDELIALLKIGLCDYVHKTGHKEVVVNSSGGIDSAVVIALAAATFGGNKVHCIMMPSKYSSEGSTADARLLHHKFGCHEYKVPIQHTEIFEMLLSAYRSMGKGHPVAEENLQARLRGMMGSMFFSNRYGALPLTTGNKTELALGYCTLYGDMSGGFNPIGDLYKDQVYQIGIRLGVPNEIINKAPSAELAPDQTDEASLMPYNILNKIVKLYIEDYVSSYDRFMEITKLDDGVVSRSKYNEMIRKININEFKRRQATPCIKVSKVAFGTGRRMPLVRG